MRERPTARALLGPDGPLARALPGYEEREGQLAMADAVERALAEERPLVCEAGTGTGKTLAYLVPAILSGKKVVVSTATKALEEQIFHKDLPLVARHLGLDPRAALVKGLGNYLCLRRFRELREGGVASSDPAVARALPMLEAWAAETETGDVSELSGLADDDRAWREVASSSETRIGAGCEHFDRCFVTRMKREAERARIVVVNHHLFFADLALKSPSSPAGVLPPYDAVVLDEAHQLEDIATAFFGTRTSRAKVEAMLRDAERAAHAAGFGAAGPLAAGPGGALAGLSGAVRSAAERLFDEVARATTRGGRPAEDARVPLARDAWQGALLDAYLALDGALEALAGWAETHAVSDAVRLVATRAAATRDDLAKIADPATNQITWAEVRARSVALGASPVDLARVLREKLFDRVGPVVLTSATLATAPTRRGDPPSFSFLRARLGLDEGGALEVEELAVPSPFDHRASALLYVASDLPETNDAEFLPRAAERIAELVGVTGGGAFVLCTSVRAMRWLGSALRGKTPEPLLVQGEAPKATLLARFRDAGSAVLVATMSFWEGVDVPGDALRLVVLEKIPFAVPTDPILLARAAALEAEGKNPFTAYQLPQAAITLKQGFGRLLRTRADRGIVALLDRRVRTRSYGASLLASLPPASRTESLAEVRAFWAIVSERA